MLVGDVTRYLALAAGRIPQLDKQGPMQVRAAGSGPAVRRWRQPLRFAVLWLWFCCAAEAQLLTEDRGSVLLSSPIKTDSNGPFVLQNVTFSAKFGGVPR
jgi:hypothetical protein